MADLTETPILTPDQLRKSRQVDPERERRVRGAEALVECLGAIAGTDFDEPDAKAVVEVAAEHASEVAAVLGDSGWQVEVGPMKAGRVELTITELPLELRTPAESENLELQVVRVSEVQAGDEVYQSNKARQAGVLAWSEGGVAYLGGQPVSLGIVTDVFRGPRDVSRDAHDWMIQTEGKPDSTAFIVQENANVVVRRAEAKLKPGDKQPDDKQHGPGKY